MLRREVGADEDVTTTPSPRFCTTAERGLPVHPETKPCRRKICGHPTASGPSGHETQRWDAAFYEKRKGEILLLGIFLQLPKKSEPQMSRALVRQETIAGYLFLLPSLTILSSSGFVIYPMLMCVFIGVFLTRRTATVPMSLSVWLTMWSFFGGKVFLGALRQHPHHCYRVGAYRLHLLSLWSGLRHRQHAPRGSTSLFRVIFYSARCHRGSVARYGRVEADVRQLLRHLCN
ncbi:MAG: hypothetical protein ACLUGI_11415 [Subdoligranulum sp.]